MGKVLLPPNPFKDLGALLISDGTYNSSNQFTVTGGVPVQVPNDKDVIQLLSAPDEMVNIINTSGEITPLNGNNDSYLFRINMQTDPDSNNSAIFLTVDIGSGSPIVVYADTKRLAANRNTVSPLSFTLPIFAGATFLANNGSILIDTDDNFVNIYDISYYIERKFLGFN